jgi:hypothetical protein
MCLMGRHAGLYGERELILTQRRRAVQGRDETGVDELFGGTGGSLALFSDGRTSEDEVGYGWSVGNWHGGGGDLG